MRLLATGFKGGGFAGKLADYGSFYGSLLFALLFGRKSPDLILSLTTLPYIGLLENWPRGVMRAFMRTGSWISIRRHVRPRFGAERRTALSHFGKAVALSVALLSTDHCARRHYGGSGVNPCRPGFRSRASGPAVALWSGADLRPRPWDNVTLCAKNAVGLRRMSSFSTRATWAWAIASLSFTAAAFLAGRGLRWPLWQWQAPRRLKPLRNSTPQRASNY